MSLAWCHSTLEGVAGPIARLKLEEFEQRVAAGGRALAMAPQADQLAAQGLLAGCSQAGLTGQTALRT